MRECQHSCVLWMFICLLANIVMIVGWIRLFSWPCSSSLTCFTIMLMSFCRNKLTVYYWIVAFSIAVKPKTPVNKERLIFPTCHTFLVVFIASKTHTCKVKISSATFSCCDVYIAKSIEKQQQNQIQILKNDISETNKKENELIVNLKKPQCNAQTKERVGFCFEIVYVYQWVQK